MCIRDRYMGTTKFCPPPPSQKHYQPLLLVSVMQLKCAVLVLSAHFACQMFMTSRSTLLSYQTVPLSRRQVHNIPIVRTLRAIRGPDPPPLPKSTYATEEGHHGQHSCRNIWFLFYCDSLLYSLRTSSS